MTFPGLLITASLHIIHPSVMSKLTVSYISLLNRTWDIRLGTGPVFFGTPCIWPVFGLICLGLDLIAWKIHFSFWLIPASFHIIHPYLMYKSTVSYILSLDILLYRHTSPLIDMLRSSTLSGENHRSVDHGCHHNNIFQIILKIW